MSKHTPGPWSLWGKANPSQVISYEHGFIAQTVGGNDEANARLIAAAPELLIELRQAVIQMEMAAECIQEGRYDEALLHASSLMRSKRAAIAKATGE